MLRKLRLRQNNDFLITKMYIQTYSIRFLDAFMIKEAGCSTAEPGFCAEIGICKSLIARVNIWKGMRFSYLVPETEPVFCHICGSFLVITFCCLVFYYVLI